MPKIKIEHITSFSSEDNIHTAENILSADPSKKWKCKSTGEKTASLVLQLEKASVINSIDIGNEHSAYVEVLVNRSGISNDDFCVLLVMSSFMSPLESRQSQNINKVRMFGYNDLQSPERDQKWDRVKIVCTQPFNRHVQYGLSFLTLHSLTKTTTESNVTSSAVKLGNFSLRPSSPDSFSAGSLFAKRKETTPLSIAAAIRDACSSGTSPQIKHKLAKTPVTQTPPTAIKTVTTSDTDDLPKKRNRKELLYSEDEEAPNKKIDEIIEQKEKEKMEKQNEDLVKKEKEQQKKKIVKPSTSKDSEDIQTEEHNKRKLEETPTTNKKIKKNNCKPYKQLLQGVIIVISGIQNPERATIRSQALEMGAKYKSDWDNACTHLICAFTNTPKFKQVQGKGKIVNRLWVSDCYSTRKRLPWRRYALDLQEQTKAESEDEICEEKSNSPDVSYLFVQENKDGSDTDAEDLINNGHSNTIQNHRKPIVVDNFDLDTDEEENSRIAEADAFSSLPDFFSNKVMHIDQSMADKTIKLLTRYITAYKGLLLDEPSDAVDYVISVGDISGLLKNLCPNAEFATPDWIWECHNSKKMVPCEYFKL